MVQPRLTFFCELPHSELTEMFADAQIIEELRALKASVSLGLLDLSPERAAVVRQLNAAGVPLVAWLLLPKDQGYWFNIGNAQQALMRYRAFRDWTATHQLEWSRVGLDIEPDIREIQALSVRGALLSVLLRRLFDDEQLHQARRLYAALVTQIRADGYPVDSYQMPFIVDERRVKSTLLQRLGGIVDLEVDREVLMLYSSLLGSLGAGFVWSYAGESGSVGVGVTGGGVELPARRKAPFLTWAELERDLLIAWRWNADIHIFSLEGCVRQGFLSRLRTINWRQTISPPPTAPQVRYLRRLLRVGLWISRRPLWTLAGLFIFFWLIARLRRRD